MRVAFGRLITVIRVKEKILTSFRTTLSHISRSATSVVIARSADEIQISIATIGWCITGESCCMGLCFCFDFDVNLIAGLDGAIDFSEEFFIGDT